MIFGMSFVFVFLTLLIMTTKLMSFILMGLQSEETHPITAVPSSQTVTDNSQLMAVLQAAVDKHRSQ